MRFGSMCWLNRPKRPLASTPTRRPLDLRLAIERLDQQSQRRHDDRLSVTRGDPSLPTVTNCIANGADRELFSASASY